MFKHGNDTSFTLKPRGELGVLFKSGMQDFYGNIAIECGVVCLKNRRHTSLAQLIRDPVWPNVFSKHKRHHFSCEFPESL
jgi:hypothetical protein